MKRLVVASWALLLYIDLLTCLGGFSRVYRLIRSSRMRKVEEEQQASSADISYAMDVACVFYFKPVRCLQRSAALTVLLRRYGWNADLVLGAQILPFKSHAWVELEGLVVNDKSYIPEIYRVWQRCCVEER